MTQDQESRADIDTRTPQSARVYDYWLGGSSIEPAVMAEVVKAAEHGGMTLVPRDRDLTERFFGAWEFVEPGLVPVMGRRPEGEPPGDPRAAYYWAGVARKTA